MLILNCSQDDIPVILDLYSAARALQTEKRMVVWPVFDSAFIEQEIVEGRQWKLIVDEIITCNWAITFDDKQIWGERDLNDAIYIHRIATNPHYRGNRYIDIIVEWAKQYTSSKGKQFIRLDTLGHNTGLIAHYISAGFTFLGIFKLEDTAGLPGHYQVEPNCCKFEMSVDISTELHTIQG